MRGPDSTRQSEVHASGSFSSHQLLLVMGGQTCHGFVCLVLGTVLLSLGQI